MTQSSTLHYLKLVGVILIISSVFRLSSSSKAREYIPVGCEQIKVLEMYDTPQVSGRLLCVNGEKADTYYGCGLLIEEEYTENGSCRFVYCHKKKSNVTVVLRQKF